MKDDEDIYSKLGEIGEPDAHLFPQIKPNETYDLECAGFLNTYIPQMEVSGRDVIDLANKQKCNSVADMLTKEGADKALIYIQPDSKGVAIIDGKKYNSIGRKADPNKGDKDNKFLTLFSRSLVGAIIKKQVEEKYKNKRYSYIISRYCNTLIDKFFKGESMVINPETSSLVILEGVKEIVPKACKGSKLREVKFPKGLNKIGKETFEESNLRKVNLPDDVIVKEGAFRACKKLRDVKLEGKATIDLTAFEDCPELKHMILSNGIEIEPIVEKSKTPDEEEKTF